MPIPATESGKNLTLHALKGLYSFSLLLLFLLHNLSQNPPLHIHMSFPLSFPPHHSPHLTPLSPDTKLTSLCYTTAPPPAIYFLHVEVYKCQHYSPSLIPPSFLPTVHMPISLSIWHLYSCLSLTLEKE